MANEQDITPAEIQRLRNVTRNEATRQRALMGSLIDDPSFVYFKEQMQAQIDNRLRELLMIPRSVDDMIQKAYNMGEMAGIKLAIDFPEVLVEYAKSSLESINRSEEIEEDANYGQTSESDSSSYDSDLDADRE